MQKEYRVVSQRESKLAPGNARTFTGYGAVFGNVDAHGDVIAPGAFTKTLAEHKAAETMPLLLGQHGDASGMGDAMMPIGVWTSMAEDSIGLRVEGKLSDTPRGNEAYTLLKDGALGGLSIGYRARDFTRGGKAGRPARTLTDVELLEVSLVTFPSNPLARVDGVKLAPGQPITRILFKKALQQAGFPRSWVAKAAYLLEDNFKDEPLSDDDTAELVSAIKASTASLNRIIKRI